MTASSHWSNNSPPQRHRNMIIGRRPNDRPSVSLARPALSVCATLLPLIPRPSIAPFHRRRRPGSGAGVSPVGCRRARSIAAMSAGRGCRCSGCCAAVTTAADDAPATMTTTTTSAADAAAASVMIQGPVVQLGMAFRPQ